VKRRVRVSVLLDRTIATMLDVIAKHTGKSRDDVMADALVRLYVALPRPDD
jgi:hypothetical protein